MCLINVGSEVDDSVKQSHDIILEEIVDCALIGSNHYDFKELKCEPIRKSLHHFEDFNHFVISEVVFGCGRVHFDHFGCPRMG